MSPAELSTISIDTDVAQRFASVAGRFASKIAIDDGRHRFTYGELLRYVDALAGELAARVDTRGRVVTILMPTDALHIASVLAVARSGGIYLSLDPAYPAARLREMIASVDAAIVITTTALRERAKDLGAPALLDLDETPRVARDVVAPPRGPDAFACLYFTSGSTGRPKAIVHTHRNILFDIRRQTRDMRVTPADRFDLLFSASFSAFLSPVFGALLTGASVHPFALKTHPIETFRDWLQREAITVSTMSVSSFRQFASVLPNARGFPALRMLSVGAEPLALHDLEAFQKHFSEHCLLQNALATTETRTIAQVCYLATGPRPAQMAVGFPVDGKSLTLRDDTGRPVAHGDVGEIVIESAYISPGRWDELRHAPGAALPAPRTTTHATGDLARMLDDGQLVHVGRSDTQVKIRGHRIEVVEIESALLAHPSVQNAAVFATPADGGRELLVALVVGRDSQRCDTAALRRHLLGSLPDYMVPNRFVATEVLPATPSGKLDRKQLHDHFAQLDAATRAAGMPCDISPREAQLLELWRQVLRSPHLGPDDDFFDVGGDSLRAAQLAARISELARRHVPPGVLIEAPTVRALAARLATAEDRTTPLRPLLLQQGRDDLPPLYLVSPWNSGSVLFRNLANETPRGGSIWAIDGYDDADLKPHTIEQIATLYVDTLLARHTDGGFGLAGYSMGGFVVWEVAQQLAAHGRRPRCVVLIDCPRFYSATDDTDRAWLARASSARGRATVLVRTAVRAGMAHSCALLGQMVVPPLRRAKWYAWGRWFPKTPPPWESDYQRNIALSRRYRVRPYDGAVTLVRATKQGDWVTRVQHDLGWSGFCRGPFAVVNVPGDHHALLAPPDVSVLNRALHDAVIDRAGLAAHV